MPRRDDVGLELGHVPTADGFPLDVRGDGGPCPRCDGTLDSGTIAGRTSWWCPDCQEPPD